MRIDISIEGDDPIQIAMLVRGTFGRPAKQPKSKPKLEPTVGWNWKWKEPHVAQVGTETFIWFDDAGLPGGVEQSLNLANNARIRYEDQLNEPVRRTVDCETIQENDFLELTLYGDCLYVLFADGKPVWCGHSETEGWDKAQVLQDEHNTRSAMPTMPATKKVKDPDDGLPNDFPRLSDPKPVTEEEIVKAGIDYDLPVVEADIMPLDAVESVVKQHKKKTVPKETFVPAEPVEPDYPAAPVGEPLTCEEPEYACEPDPTVDEGGFYWPKDTVCKYADCTAYLNEFGRRRANGYCSEHRHKK